MSIQVNFDQPNQISSGWEEKNDLVIRLVNTRFFKRKKDGLRVLPLTEIQKELPEIVDEDIADAITAVAEAVNNSGQVVLTASYSF